MSLYASAMLRGTLPKSGHESAPLFGGPSKFEVMLKEAEAGVKPHPEDLAQLGSTFRTHSSDFRVGDLQRKAVMGAYSAFVKQQEIDAQAIIASISQ